MAYTDWQLLRMRNALRAYHRYGGYFDGDVYTWIDVSEAIAEYCDVEVPQESLRKFVEGVKKKDGTRKYSTPEGPQDERIHAIFKFVQEEDLNLLNEDELKERTFGLQAANRMVEYLEEDQQYTQLGIPANIAGRYYNWREDGDHVWCSELTIDQPLDNRIAVVHLLERSYMKGEEPSLVDVAIGDMPLNYKSQTRLDGWLAVSPEENMMFFLKEVSTGLNRRYLLLDSTLGLNVENSPLEFNLLFFHAPMEVQHARSLASFKDPSQENLEKSLHRYARLKR